MTSLRYANALPTLCQRIANGMHRAVTVNVTLILDLSESVFAIQEQESLQEESQLEVLL